MKYYNEWLELQVKSWTLLSNETLHKKDPDNLSIFYIIILFFSISLAY